MRVLLTVHQFFPHHASGTEVLTRAVARELLLRGHEVRVLTGFPADQAMPDRDRCDEYVFEGMHVYRFRHAYTPMAGQTSLIELSYDNRLAAEYFERILEQYRPDVVHFFHLNRLGSGLIERARHAGVPAFMTPTDFWAVCPTGQLVLPDGGLCRGPTVHAGNCVRHVAQNTQGGLPGFVVRWLPTVLFDAAVRLTLAGVMPSYPFRGEVQAVGSRLNRNIERFNLLQGILAPNRFMHELLLRHGVLPELMRTSGYGIDIPEEALNASRAAPRRPFRFGFIGTLAPHKGCHVLIDAFKALPEGLAVLEIYGSTDDFPEDSSELKQRAGNHAGVAFRGVFPNSRIAEVLAGLDALVVPSLWYENTPLVVYSAQAARCPVVASDLPGITEAIRDGEDGLLFEAGNASALTNRLSRLVGERGLAEKLSANSPKPKSTRRYVDELLGLWAMG